MEAGPLIWGAGGLLLAVGAVVAGWLLAARPKPRALPPPPRAGPERRREPRHPVGGAPIQISDADASSTPVTGMVVDCSVSGIGLQVNDSIPVGTMLSLRPVGMPSSTTWALVEVKHVTPRDGNWKIGCRFIRTPPWVGNLLGPAP